MARLFISYRRSDTGAYAGRIADRLSAFQFDAVFQDREGIGVGSNYADEIRSALSQCDAVLVLIGSSWTAARDGSGARRLDDPADWVRREVALAISLEVPIVPVLFDGARTPSASDLPSDLSALSTAQGYDVNGNYFERDADDLARRIEQLLVRRRQRETKEQPSAPRGSFQNELLAVIVGLFAISFATSMIPSYVPQLPKLFWMFPAMLTVPAFMAWIYLRGEETLRARRRFA